MSEKTLGQVGFDAYGNAGERPWQTFDGRPMPQWDTLDTPAGELTKARWEEAAKAVVRDYCVRAGVPFVEEVLSGGIPAGHCVGCDHRITPGENGPDEVDGVTFSKSGRVLCLPCARRVTETRPPP